MWLKIKIVRAKSCFLLSYASSLLPSSSVDIRAIREYRRVIFKPHRHGEGWRAVRWPRLQPGIRQDSRGLSICLNSSRGDGTKDCLREREREREHTHMHTSAHTHAHIQRGLYERLHIYTTSVQMTVWESTHALRPASSSVSACGLTLLSECKSENMIQDPVDEIKTFLNDAASLPLVWTLIKSFALNVCVTFFHFWKFGL